MDDEQAKEEQVSLPLVRDKVASSRERHLRACVTSCQQRNATPAGREGTHGSEDHLRESELGRSDTGNLAEQVEPARSGIVSSPSISSPGTASETHHPTDQPMKARWRFGTRYTEAE